MTLLAEANGSQVWHRDWRALLDVVPSCDALIVDAPYSAKTHAKCNSDVLDSANDGSARRPLDYAAWGADDVRSFVEAWSARAVGWIASVTDDVLAPVWRAEFERAGRFAFAPLPFVAPGSRVRLAGDGPSCWTTWVVVARPRNKEFARWGTLPGAYVLPPGESERMPVVGGKPTWLTRALVRDYTRPGDLVVDPCCGGGSTLVGAIREGRRAIGGDMNLDHARMAADWIGECWARSPKAAAVQPSLFGAP